MRLPRPYTPVDIKLQVAERQCRERFGIVPHITVPGKMRRLRALLHVLGDGQPMELHHRPALCNRQYRRVDCDLGGEFRYIPDANDPEYLVYVTKADHDVETRVRGQHGQHSDLALLRKSKRILRKRQLHEDGRPVWTGKQAQGPHPKPKRKYKWPKRKMQSRNTLSRSRASGSRQRFSSSRWR